ncbi:G protein-coupled receptor 89 [Amanita muscaria]
MSSVAILQNVSLIALRLGLFCACRKYLSKSLYPDLASLSIDASPDIPSTTRHTHPSTVEVELGILPSPASLPVDGSSSRRMASSQKVLHSSISQAMFSLVLTESCILFLLLVLQATNTLNSSTRLYNWRYSLTFLTISILAIIPQCMSLLLMVGMQPNQSSGRRKFHGVRIAISFIPVIALLFAIAHIPLPKGLTSHDTMTSILSRLIILGTIILGLLSGFGAISNSWGFIPFFSNSRPVPTEQQISSTEYSLSAIRNDLKDRHAVAARKPDSSADRTWLSRVSATFRPGSELDQEIRGLEALEYEMVRKVEALRDARDAAKFSSSWRGRAFRVVGYLFAIYCVVRILSALANLFIPSQRLASSETTYSDIISELVVYVLSWIYTKRSIRLEDVTPIARQLSLVFVGIMILTSVRLVLRGVTRALRVTSRNLSASLMLLILAQLMGIYLLSTIVQMRSSFPPPPKSPNDNAEVVNLFSTIPPYEVFGSLFDWSFLIAAISSTVVRWGAQKVNNASE